MLPFLPLDISPGREPGFKFTALQGRVDTLLLLLALVRGGKRIRAVVLQ